MPVVYILMTLTVFWRLWTPIHGAQRTWKYDPQHAYWGDMVFQSDTLSQGQVALWNPHDRAGYPVYGDPQPGLFYPPNWPLLLWGSFSESLPFSIASFKILLHWIFGAIGMHLLIRRFGGKEPACYTAGILFSFTSPKLRYMGSALNWSVAWIPWVLLAIDWFAEKPNAKRGIVMGSALAMVLLSGAPAVVLYTLVIALPFGLYRMRSKIKENWKPIGIATGVTLLWTLPLMASNLEQLPESVRQVRTYAFITDSVFTPGHLLSFLVPRLGQGENPYIGGFGLLCIGLALAHPKHRNLAWIFLAITTFALAISLGSHAGFLPALASSFSPFSLFRRAHRYLYISSLTTALLAGLGFAYVLSLECEERKAQVAKFITLFGGALSFALGLAYLISVVVQDKINAPKNIGFGLAFLSAAVFTILLRQVLVSKGKLRTSLAWAIPLFVFLDISTANHKAAEMGLTNMPLTPNDGAIADLEGLEKEWRVYDDDFLNYRPGTRLKIRDFSGYEEDPLALSRYQKLRLASKKSPVLMGHANVRYILDGKGPVRPNAKFAKLVAPKIWELNNVAPAVYFVPFPKVVANPEEALKALRTMVPGENAVVEGLGKQPVFQDSKLAPTAGHLQILEPNFVRAEIETPGPGLVIIAESYYSKWQATLDGNATPILPANLMFRGIVVPSAGKHVIEMRLRPRRFWFLLPAYFIAFALLAWAATRRESVA